MMKVMISFLCSTIHDLWLGVGHVPKGAEVILYRAWDSLLRADLSAICISDRFMFSVCFSLSRIPNIATLVGQ